VSFKISVETSLDAFEALRTEWNELADRMDCPELFYRWEWAWLCHKHLRSGSELLILLLREKGRLVALAPLCVVTRKALGMSARVVETIVTGHADYANLLVCASQHRRRIVRAILDWLYTNRKAWDVIDLSQLSSRDATSFHLATVTSEFPDLKAVMRPSSRAPKLDYALFPTKRRENQVHRIKSGARKLAEQGYTLTIGAETSDDLWAAFCDLHRARWSASPFHTREGAAFYDELRRELGRQGQVEFSYLALHGRPVAVHFGFRDPRKIYFYMPVADSEFRNRRVGAVLADAMVEHYATSHREFDFLRGDEDYKYWWTDDVTVNFRLLIFRRDNLAALAYNAGPAASEFLGSLAFPGLLRQRLKTLWRRSASHTSEE